MSAISSIEKIFLQLHQSFGLPPFTSKQKRSFADGKRPITKHHEQLKEIIDGIFQVLDVSKDQLACVDLIDKMEEFTNFQKGLELKTWTFAADGRQVLWQLLAHSYIPYFARVSANWNLAGAFDQGMPGGHFWFLPGKADGNSDKLLLPVAQVSNWLLDLLGIKLHDLQNNYIVNDASLTDGDDIDGEALIRNIFNWRSGVIPNSKTITNYFPDGVELKLNGVFVVDDEKPIAEQFQQALTFVRNKELTAERLQHEIPISKVDVIQNILNGTEDLDTQAHFINLLAIRFAKPTIKLIRQRFLIARAMQDGYVRLLKFLCPNVPPTCTDLKQNKLLQLIGLYQHIYNLTIQAYVCNNGQVAEDNWFDSQLNPIDKLGLFVAIAPSLKNEGNSLLGELLTKRFSRMCGGEELPNLFDPAPQSNLDILKQKVLEMKVWAEETEAEYSLLDKLRSSSPWRILQKENRYWVINQLAQNTSLNFKCREAAIMRMQEVAASTSEYVTARLVEVHFLMELPRKKQTKDVQQRVESKLADIELQPGASLWQAPLFNLRGKHLLAKNDFKNAVKYFNLALEAGKERSYGPLIGEVARDAFATVLQIQKLNPNNHERYLRDMMANGGLENIAYGIIPNLQDVALLISDYFWTDLYKPYPGFTPLSSSKPFGE